MRGALTLLKVKTRRTKRRRTKGKKEKERKERKRKMKEIQDEMSFQKETHPEFHEPGWKWKQVLSLLH